MHDSLPFFGSFLKMSALLLYPVIVLSIFPIAERTWTLALAPESSVLYSGCMHLTPDDPPSRRATRSRRAG